MSACDKLSLYLYNEMTQEEAKEFEKHIEKCSDCQNSIMIFKSIQETKEVQSAPLNVISGIFDKTSRKKKNTWEIEKAGKIGFIIAATFIAGFFLSPSQNNQSQVYVSYYDILQVSDEDIENIDSVIDELESQELI